MNTPTLRSSALLDGGALLPDGNLSTADRARMAGQYALVDWRSGVRLREGMFLDPCPVAIPDGTIGRGDRESLLGDYPGIAAAALGSDRMAMMLDAAVLLPDGGISANERVDLLGQTHPYVTGAVYASPQHSLTLAVRLGL